MSVDFLRIETERVVLVRERDSPGVIFVEAAQPPSAAVFLHEQKANPHPQYALAAALGGYQPLDSDLTALAALNTTPFGRALLELADAGAGRTALGLGTAALAASADFDVAGAASTVLSTAEAYADSLVVGLWDDRGNYDASVNTFPASGGSGAAGAIVKGDIWTISVAGTLGGVPVATRQTVRALIDTPAQTAANWAIGLANTDIDDSITDGVTGRAPSQNAVFDALALKVPTSRTVNGQALSGDVTISTISGNAGTATALQTARRINGKLFDGTADISTLNRTAVKTANYTAAANDLVPCDTTSASFTVTLPTAPANGSEIEVKQIIRGGTNTVTVACGGSDVINRAGGATSATVTVLAEAAKFQYDSATAIWTIISNDVPLTQLDARYLGITATAAKATILETARTIDGQSFDGSGNITVIAPGTHAATSKATPVDADEIPLVDSAAANVLKKLTWANLKATLKTYLDTLYLALTSLGTGVATFLATPSSANLAAAITDETGTGALVFGTTPTLTTPAIAAVAYASLPAASGVSGSLARATDLGANGTHVVSNGSRWRPLGGRVALTHIATPVTGIGSGETIFAQTLLPVNSWQVGDSVWIYCTLSKSGTTDSTQLTVRIGTGGTTADTALTGLTNFAIMGAAGLSGGFLMEIKLISATSAQKVGATAANQGSYTVGSSASATSAATTITSAAANALYVSVSCKSTSTNDTISANSARIEMATP